MDELGMCAKVYVARIWSVARLTKRAAPLINLSIAQHLTNCAIFGQSRSALAIELGLGLGLELGLELMLGYGRDVVLEASASARGGLEVVF